MARYVEMKHIHKVFAGVRALDDVSFQANEGEVCALVGENGAGKSTVLKILCGVYQADSGKMFMDGEELHFSDPMDAIKKGISIISQERQLVPYLSVMENIFMEDLPSKAFIFVDKKKMEKECQNIIDAFKIPIHPKDRVETLSVAYQQMVEIMKSYRRNGSVIVFDEPTAPLSDSEINALFDIIKQLREEGKIILYVSHRLSELFQIADKIVILKDGKLVTCVKPEEMNEQQLIAYMVGRDLGDVFKNISRNTKISKKVILEVRNLCNNYINKVSFSLHQGEILGLSGLVGAGRTETVRAIYGADPLKSGEILLNGKQIIIKDPKDAILYGIGLCPEDRKEQGLNLFATIRENISLPILDKVVRGLFINKKAETRMAQIEVKRFSIKTPTVEKQVIELSGGNQQKVILGRWMAAHPDVLILDEPTKGIDAGAKSEIYQTVCDLAKLGIGIIFISSELTEVINVCDRIVVMREGRITGELTRQEATEEKVLGLAMIENA